MVHKFSRRILLGGAVTAGAVAASGSALAFAEGDGAAAGTQSRVGKLPLIGPVEGERLHVMSFNIRTGVDAGARSWKARLPRIEKLIKAEQPTFIGAQEGRIWQVRELKQALLPGFGAVWRGRDADGGGETCAIFYRKDRLEKLDEGHRWLSKTPSVPGSISWGAKFTRMMTWVRFRDKKTGREFLHVNAHFDHYSSLARRHSAHLVRDWIQERRLPAIVTGDFNTGADSVPHDTLTAGNFHDSWSNKDKRVTPTFGTANGWNPKPKPGGRRIDWILGTKAVAVHKTGTNTWVTEHDNTPSDHWPVQAVVSLRS